MITQHDVLGFQNLSFQDKKPDSAKILEMKYFFNAYTTDKHLQMIIDNKNFADLNVNSSFNSKDFKAVPQKCRTVIPEYIKDYVFFKSICIRR